MARFALLGISLCVGDILLSLNVAFMLIAIADVVVPLVVFFVQLHVSVFFWISSARLFRQLRRAGLHRAGKVKRVAKLVRLSSIASLVIVLTMGPTS